MTYTGYYSHILTPINKTQTNHYPQGLLVTNQNGQIIFCGNQKDFDQTKLTTKHHHHHKIITPGLIDPHLHLPQLTQRGRYGKTLLDWLDSYIFPAEKEFENNNIAQKTARNLFQELKTWGTTTAVVYSSIHAQATDLAFRKAEKSGLRIMMGKVMMDQNCPDFLQENTAQSLSESQELCQKWHQKTERLHYVFSPRFAPTCSEKLMRETARLAQENNAYIQTHLNENQSEIEWVLKLFPQFKNYTDVYFQTGLLGEKTLLGHGIHMTAEEFELIRTTNSKIVHCPDSNFFLSSGQFPLKKYDQHNLPFGLASDIGGGSTLNMWQIMKMMQYMQLTPLNPQQLFFHATLGNAQVLGMEDQIGSLETNKQADFLILDPAQIDPKFSLENKSKEDLLAFLIYRSETKVAEKVFVGGEEV